MNVTIEISDTDEPRLRELAQRCGYDNVERFVSAYVAGLARRDGGEGLAPMSEEELQASLAMIDESMRQIDAGEGLTLEEARDALLRPLREQAG